MALSGSRMGIGMVTQIQAIPGIQITNTAELTAFCQAIGAAIVAEITGNADVLPVAHAGEALSTASGTPSQGADPQGGTVNSTVSADTPIVGKGSIL